jgi:hypothetical protein
MQKEWKKIELPLDQIEAYALRFSQEKCSWHFHILTGDCMLNQSCEHAFILESPTSEEFFFHHCSEKPMEAGKRLAKLLHGNDIVQDSPVEGISQMPAAAAEIIIRAKELSANGTLWHHHMLFPDCVFNKHPGSWTIMFEDSDRKQILESVSDREPRPELKEIETLFYGQRG